MICTYFDRTLKYYGIQAKALSQVTGVSENHISEFRRGKLKTGMTTAKLWDLIVAMDELAPGSREYFCMLMSGVSEFSPKHLGVGEQLEYLIDVADEEDINRLFIKIAQVWTQRRNDVKPKNVKLDKYRRSVEFYENLTTKQNACSIKQTMEQIYSLEKGTCRTEKRTCRKKGLVEEKKIDFEV